MIYWALLGGGIVLLYGMWFFSLASWHRLTELGVAHSRSFVSFFDAIALSGLFSVLVSRIIWMLMNMSLFQDVPWGILPYIRTADGISWFSVFPWRFFMLTEGVNYQILWGVFGFIVSIVTFVPTILLSRKLKAEKRRIMGGYIIRSILGIVVVWAFSALLVYVVR